MTKSVGLRLLAALLLSQLTAGCIGVGVLAVNECESTVPICDYIYGPDFWGPEMHAKDASSAPNYLLSKEEFLAVWGEPTETIVLSDDEVTLVYQRPDVWCGAIPVWVLIPAPLVSPNCKIFDRITFKGSKATHIHFQREDHTAAWIMPMPWVELLKSCPKPCPPETLDNRAPQ